MFGTTWKYSQTENRIQFDCKISMPSRKFISISILPSTHFQNYTLLTHFSHTLLTWSKLTSAPPHTPTSVRGPPTLRQATLPFPPSRRWVFSLFFSSLTQPHHRSLQALHVPDPPRQNSPSHQWSHTRLQHLRSIASDAKFSNPPSTIADPHPLKPI